MASANYLSQYFSRFVIAAAIFCVIVGSVQAQTNPAYAIEAKAIYDGNNVILRWAPKDFNT